MACCLDDSLTEWLVSSLRQKGLYECLRWLCERSEMLRSIVLGLMSASAVGTIRREKGRGGEGMQVKAKYSGESPEIG